MAGLNSTAVGSTSLGSGPEEGSCLEAEQACALFQELDLTHTCGASRQSLKVCCAPTGSWSLKNTRQASGRGRWGNQEQVTSTVEPRPPRDKQTQVGSLSSAVGGMTILQNSWYSVTELSRAPGSESKEQRGRPR
jgi:hypothetical protein